MYQKVFCKQKGEIKIGIKYYRKLDRELAAKAAWKRLKITIKDW